jgi:tRNA pseudouridine32 synthase / 23S rRNA pseudouridine746 synthase
MSLMSRMNWRTIREESVVFEDEAILALNKPAGVSVMGERHETDLVRLAEEEAGERLFPVHRIDKATSGLVLFARELRFHGGLTRQFNKQTVDKAYLAIVRSGDLPERGTIDLPLGVGRKNRVRVAGNRDAIAFDGDGDGDGASGIWSLPPGAEFGEKRSYPSLTRFVRVWGDERHALLAVRPVTGRRHQIRVHLAWIGHPVEGDPLFDKESAARPVVSCHLHSWRLAFDAEWREAAAPSAARMRLTAPPPAAFWSPLGERIAATGHTTDELLRLAAA